MSRFISSLSTVAVLGALSVALSVPVTGSAQSGRHRDREREDSQDAQSRIDTTFTFNKTGTVDLTEVSGDVVVNAWDRNEARVRAHAERGRIRSSLSTSR